MEEQLFVVPFSSSFDLPRRMCHNLVDSLTSDFEALGENDLLKTTGEDFFTSVLGEEATGCTRYFSVVKGTYKYSIH